MESACCEVCSNAHLQCHSQYSVSAGTVWTGNYGNSSNACTEEPYYVAYRFNCFFRHCKGVRCLTFPRAVKECAARCPLGAVKAHAAWVVSGTVGVFARIFVSAKAYAIWCFSEFVEACGTWRFPEVAKACAARYPFGAEKACAAWRPLGEDEMRVVSRINKCSTRCAVGYRICSCFEYQSVPLLE